MCPGTSPATAICMGCTETAGFSLRTWHPGWHCQREDDPKVVVQVFERDDLLLRPEQVFPVEVRWNAETRAAYRAYWRRGTSLPIASSLWMTIQMELAEVAAAHPGIECVLFPKNDYAAGSAMFRSVSGRLWQGTGFLRRCPATGEYRRGASSFRVQVAAAATPEGFLAQAEAVVTFDFGCAAEPRVLEFVAQPEEPIQLKWKTVHRSGLAQLDVSA